MITVLVRDLPKVLDPGLGLVLPYHRNNQLTFCQSLKWYQQNENTNLIANRFSITGSGTHLTKSGRQPVLSIALRTLTFFWLVGTARLKSSNNFTSKYFRWQRKLSGQFDLRATCWGWGAGCLVRYWQLICWPQSLNVSSANPVLEHTTFVCVYNRESPSFVHVCSRGSTTCVCHVYMYICNLNITPSNQQQQNQNNSNMQSIVWCMVTISLSRYTATQTHLDRQDKDSLVHQDKNHEQIHL